MITKTQEEIELIRQSARLVSSSLALVAERIRPGISSLELDQLVEDYIHSYNGAVPSFKDYNGFPFSICSSVNDAVVHGFPSRSELQEGDLISVDVGVYMNGFHGDSAYTFLLSSSSNESNQDIVRLMQTTKESLQKGIEVFTVQHRIGDVGYIIQQYCEARGYGVVRELTGHGIGKKLHEPPNIPNYGKQAHGRRIKKGAVVAIEPMINLGTPKVYTDKDGWTIRTRDGKPSAHYEHTVALSSEGPISLSNFSPIEESIAQNANLVML